jgi:hypothetical protein
MTDPIRLEDFELSYPYSSPTITVTLRAPDFGDIDRIGLTRIYRKTRGGTIKTYHQDDWPKENVRTFTFTGLSQENKDDLVSFLAQSLGKEIGIRDHEDFNWRGVILTPNNEFVAINRDNGCGEQYVFSFEFQGVKV